MKRLLAIFLLIQSFCYGQGPNTTAITVPTDGSGHTVQALLTLPDDYASTTKNYAFLVFLHGLGESGSNLSIIYTSSGAGGPAYFNAQGQWPTSFVNPADGQSYKFIVLSPQAPSGQGIGGSQIDPIVNYMIAHYRVDMNRFYLTGLSEGGQGVYLYTSGCCGVTNQHNPAAMAPMSMAGGKPDQGGCNTIISKNIRTWGFGSESDVLGQNVHLLITGNYGGNSCNCTGIGALGRFTSYTGGHCCWNQFYNPTYTEVINGTTMSMYQWMLQFTVNGASNLPPTVNAGIDQAFNLPRDTTTLTGSATDPDGTIAGYQWLQSSGTTATIVSPTSATTKITGLSTASGTRSFRLVATDNSGATGSDTVNITVNPLPTTVVSNAPFAPPTTVKIKKVAVGEYQTVYLHADGTVHFWGFVSGHYQYLDFGLTGVIDVVGEQYDCIALLSDGTTRKLRKANDGTASVVSFALDTFNRPANNFKVPYGFWQSSLALTKDDSVYYLPTGDNLAYGSLGLGTGQAGTKWMPLGQPPGRRVIKLVTFDNASAGMYIILAMCSDGSVWGYKYGSAIPTQISAGGGFNGSNAVDIGGITRAAYIIVTATDIVAFGPFSAYLSGLADGVTTPTSILTSFTNIGLSMPLKQVISNYNTIHFIDANSGLFTEGDNTQGEIGNGIQRNPWKPKGFAWDFGRGETMQSPVQIPGQWSNLWGGSNIAFMFFGTDIGYSLGVDSNLYSWGRNKQDALGNGIRAANDDSFNCAINIPAPRYVNPAGVAHVPDFNFLITNTFDPLPNAGIDQYISTTTGTLYGSGSSQPEGSITAYQWSKISGNGTITSPTAINTPVTGLGGTSLFKLTVTSNSGTQVSDTVKVVSATGTPPNVSAGTPQTIILPTSSVNLAGTASGNGGGTISSVMWSQLSGPSTSTIISPTSMSTAVTGLIAGTYTFQFSGSDSNFQTSYNQVQITVLSATPTFNGLIIKKGHTLKIIRF